MPDYLDRKLSYQIFHEARLDLICGHDLLHGRQLQDAPQHRGQGTMVPEHAVVEEKVLEFAALITFENLGGELFLAVLRDAEFKLVDCVLLACGNNSHYDSPGTPLCVPLWLPSATYISAPSACWTIVSISSFKTSCSLADTIDFFLTMTYVDRWYRPRMSWSFFLLMIPQTT